MENNLKTAEEIINDATMKIDGGIWVAYPSVLSAMQAYARQALEAYRDEVGGNLSRYLYDPENTDDGYYQRGIKRGLTELRKIDIDQFIK